MTSKRFPLFPLFAFLCGALMVPAMAPWYIWPALIIGYSGLFWILSHTTTKKAAALYGALFGFGFHFFGLVWIGNALLVEGNDYQWAWPLAVMGLPLLLAPFSALATLAAYPVIQRSLTGGFVAFIALLSTGEWLRGHLFTGFPWNLAGYTWGNLLPIAQLSALGGIYGLTLITIFWATLPATAFLLYQQKRKSLAFGFILIFMASFSLAYGWGTSRLSHNPTMAHDDIAVQIVQPNIPQHDKWDGTKTAENLRKLLALSLPSPANDGKTTLLIWPETALAYYHLQMPSIETALKTTLALYPDPVYLLTGLLRRDQISIEENHYYNSLIAYDRDLFPLTIYNKTHLVPFGEYIPFRDYIPLAPVAGFEGFDRGPGPQTLSVPDIPAFSPLICYEIVFPGAIVPRGHRPEWVVTVTNDGWYGDSAGPYQHFTQAQFRAIEEGLPVIRSANTGISGIIDPLGRIIAATPIDEETKLVAPLPQSLANSPLYYIWGDRLFFTLLASLTLIVAIMLHRRRNRISKN